MADNDDFDIDIYGDDPPPEIIQQQQQEKAQKEAEAQAQRDAEAQAQKEADTQAQAQAQAQAHPQAQSTDAQSPPNPTQQGTKRKSSTSLDPASTSALILSDLNWWTTDDDVRGYCNIPLPGDASTTAESTLTDITFSEHKVNGKSKGQAHLEFNDASAAAAVKANIEALHKKVAVQFQSGPNPFKTLPKDAPARQASASGAARGNYEARGSFRGGRGGRGGGGFTPRGGYQNNGAFVSNAGAPSVVNPQFGGAMGGTFNGNFRGGFNPRGRGGPRGGGAGMGGGGMGMGMGMPMGMPGMGGMPGMMNGMMNGMMGGMMPQGGFGAQGFGGFGAQQQFFGGDQGNWNPHGAKRPRGE